MSKVAALRIVSKRDTFRRAGFQFSNEPTDIPLATLTADERKAIKDDPSLVSYETEIDIDDPQDDPQNDAAAAPKAKSSAKK